MGYVTANTEWPSVGVPAPVMGLVERYFLLMDHEDSSVGDSLADEIFTSDGEILAAVSAHGTERESDFQDKIPVIMARG